MRITFLGTAAAEGIPAVFCNCKYCIEAKKLGGKNIRTRSQAMINDDLLIDLPADTYSHFLNNNIAGDAIKYLLVTHSHSDHFYPSELLMRNGGYAHNMRAQKLSVCCNEGAARKIKDLKGADTNRLEFKSLKPFDKVIMGDYKITALPAKHFLGDGALFYIISGEKNILYAHDTGYFYDEVFDYIRDNNFVFDLISLDCTYVDILVNDDGHHMGIDNIHRVVKRLCDIGAVNSKTKKVINHFSHNGGPLHHILEERVKEYGYVVSYDGMSIEL